MITRPLRVATSRGRLPCAGIVMGRIQWVVWAVVMLGLVGCQATVNPSKKVSQEELLALAPDLVPIEHDEATADLFRELEALGAPDVGATALFKPGETMPSEMKAQIQGYLDQLDRLTKPAWKPTKAPSEYIAADHTFFLRAIAYAVATAEPKVAARANLLNLKLSQRVASASAGGSSVTSATQSLTLAGQGLLDTLSPSASLESELVAYLTSLPKPGEFVQNHLVAARVDWAGNYVPGIVNRQFPTEAEADLFAGNRNAFDRRATAKLFLAAIRSEMSALEEGREAEFVNLATLVGFKGDESYLPDGEITGAETLKPKLKALAKTYRANAAGEMMFRGTLNPLSSSALRGEAIAAVLRGSFATMIMMNRGQRPESWEDVVKAGLVEEVPLDPYSKKPLEADFVKGQIRCQSVKISGKKLTNPLNEAVVQIPDWLLKRAGG